MNLFDAGGTRVDFVTFGAATSGHTFDQFDPVTRAATHESAAGVFGAFASVDHDIGSPGAVPEPSTMAFAALGAGCLLVYRRRRK